jgi:hypothetical protein
MIDINRMSNRRTYHDLTIYGEYIRLSEELTESYDKGLLSLKVDNESRN